MLAEASPFIDEESRAQLSAAQDKGARGLLTVADPGFVPMYEDPSVFNAAMLGVGMTGPIGKGAKGAVNLGRRVIDRAIEATLEVANKAGARRRDLGKSLEEVTAQAKQRLNLTDDELERLNLAYVREEAAGRNGLTEGAMEEFLASLDDNADRIARMGGTSTPSLGRYTTELAAKHGWASRLSPSLYDKRAREAAATIKDLELERMRVNFEPTPAFKKNFIDLPDSRKTEVMQEMGYNINATRKAAEEAQRDLAAALAGGADGAGPTVAHLKKWAEELNERYEDLVEVQGFMQQYLPRSSPPLTPKGYLDL